MAETLNAAPTLKNGRVIAIHHQPMPDGGWVATHKDVTEKAWSTRGSSSC